MPYRLGRRSRVNLAGVHPDLVSVVELAITKTSVDFTVLEGVRSKARQKALYEAGATRTLNSRHLTGHAVDLAAWVGRDVRWDWPLYDQISCAMLAASEELGVHVEWGGSWVNLKDGPHYELGWGTYPAERSDDAQSLTGWD